ncbi:MAG TPA: ethanolamine ammonia-lyase reactivating factor EutA [Stellaceae bacterium]|nr:ethanolamine ammonia-lyase reactivating factor EutA [Stellaceae bacterium]
MHDFLFDHVHLDPNDEDALDAAIWAADNLEITTVGIDIGSSTSHLMFGRLHLRRLATGLSSRFVTVKRTVLWHSPILLTPYRSDTLIDAEALGRFIRDSYAAAGLTRGAVDSGAVILTGVALTRPNARAIADLFADEAGKFVCASAGHHLEAVMAAHGSGTVALSRRSHATLLNVDIGGGTCKFSLVRDGEILGNAAIGVGGRLIVEDDEHRLIRIEESARIVARDLGFTLNLGAVLPRTNRELLVRRMAGPLIDMIRGAPLDELGQRLLLTEKLPDWRRDADLVPTALTFSGGVAEFMFEREKRRFGDIGPDLANELQHALAHHHIEAPVWDSGQGIRATVIGAAQFTVQVSGNTILISDPECLPVRNLPVVACRFEAAVMGDRGAVENIVRSAVAGADLDPGSDSFALSFAWREEPLHADLHALASGICAALPEALRRPPGLALLIDGDVGMTIGRIITTEIDPSAKVIAIDSVQLSQFDYVDIGAVAKPANVVPLIIKSLVF